MIITYTRGIIVCHEIEIDTRYFMDEPFIVVIAYDEYRDIIDEIDYDDIISIKDE